MPRFRALAIPIVAAALSVIVVAALSGPASARREGHSATKASHNSSPKVKVGNYGLSCTGLSGSITFNPPLTQKASFKKEKATVSSALSHCSAVATAGGTAVAVSSGTMTGTLTIKPGPSGITCSGILAGLANGNGSLALSGKLKAHWASSPAVSPSKTAISVRSASAPTSGGSSHQTYTIPGGQASSITGAFAGATRSGSLLALVSGLTPNQEGVQCVPSISGGNGLQTLPLSGGLFDSGAPPTSIAIAPANATISFSQCYTATGTFPGGTADLSKLASWSVAAPSVATVDSGLGSGGCVSVGGMNGTSTISASFEGTNGSTQITVHHPVTITTTSVPNGTVSVPYNQTVTAINGTTPYTWSVSFGSLPPWASLNPSSGAITGTPNAVGTATFDIQVTDSTSPTPGHDTVQLTITVN